MGGVTRRRANQVIRSLAEHGLVRADGPLHLLTNEGLKCLARRDRAAVGQVLGRWSAEPSDRNPQVYAGTALRAMASQPEHHAALTTLAAGLTAECARSRDYGVLDLLPTSRPAVGYWHDQTNYVVHPDLSFTLDLPEGYRHCFLEFERRATTPRRVRARLENYRRYFRSGYARRDHGGELPLVLFVFETPGDEDAFLDAAAGVDHAPFASSNLETIARRGILADAWLLPAPEPWERLTPRAACKSATFSGTRFPGFPVGRPRTKADDRGFVLSQPCLTPKAHLTAICCRNQGYRGRDTGPAPVGGKAADTHDTSGSTRK